MTIDGDHDLDGLRRVGRAVAEARDAMLAAVAPGVSTAELDAVGRDVLRAHGARSAPQLAYGFPGATCVSVSDEAAHGVPSLWRRLREGDLVNVDVSAELDGYWADTGASAPVGRVAPQARRLVEATRLADIGRAVQRRARRHGFSVIANLASHGVGRFLHEPPQVPNVEGLADDTVLWDGLVLAIEPLLTTGAGHVVEAGDGWTVRTPDGSLVAQFEHTMVVTHGRPLVLTAAA